MSKELIEAARARALASRERLAALRTGSGGEIRVGGGGGGEIRVGSGGEIRIGSGGEIR